MKNIIITISVLFLCLTYSIYYKKKELFKYRRYELINSEKNLSGIYNWQIQPKKNAELHLQINNEFVKLPWAENRRYTPCHLALFIQHGDSICKAANADSLYIYRGNQRYHFVLKKRIWK